MCGSARNRRSVWQGGCYRHLGLVNISTRYRPWGRDDIPLADGSSALGGSMSVRGLVRSPHMAKLQAAGCLHPTAAARLGQLRGGTDRRTDKWTDRGIA